jgi:aminomethyltransferase
MPIPTPFHERTRELCTSYRWKEWAGYYTVCSYGTCHTPEYFAFRNSAGLIDVTPLYKYEVHGPDAQRFLSRVMVKNISNLQMNQVSYLCWCDDEGKVVDDGTVSKLEENYFRVTAAEPSLSWFLRHSQGYDVTIHDSSKKIGALALQGPYSRDILNNVCAEDLNSLKFFRLMKNKIDGVDVTVTRTGYTGDLGFEVWVDSGKALKVWDSIMGGGQNFGIMPAGMDAMDVTRVEAGFIMNGVDYFSAHHCFIESRKSTPYELGLGWTVNLKRGSFIGKKKLEAEKASGPAKVFMGLDIDWDETEALFARHGLPPEICPSAWRSSIPVYSEEGEQIGYANSGSWSPVLKKNLALVTLNKDYGKPGTKLKFEMTVEYERKTVSATVLQPPFFNPPRKRS